MRVGLTVYKVLGYYVVWLVLEILVWYRLHLQSEVEARQILERDRWHPDLVLLSRHLDHLSVLVRLVQVLNAGDLGYFALGYHGVTNRLEPFELDFQKPFDDRLLSEWGNFDCYHNSGFFSFPDFESDLFKVLKPLMTPNRKHILFIVV